MTIDSSELTSLLEITVNAEDAEGEQYKNEIYIYYVNIGDTQYYPGDDIKDVVKLSLDELYALGEAYEVLPETLWYKKIVKVYTLGVIMLRCMALCIN